MTNDALQSEIQELRTKVSALESKAASLEYKSSLCTFIFHVSCKIISDWLTIRVEFLVHPAETTINSQLIV